MQINKPIFIIGSGRSGTTVLYNLLATHPELCWFSNYSDGYLNFRMIPFIHRLLDLPYIGLMAKKRIISKKKFAIKPREGNNIFYHYCHFKHAIKSTEDDYDALQEKKLKKIISNHLFLTGKKRFLHKATANTQRLRLINHMFKDAYFIHLIRDGRAVANSLIKVEWWNSTDIWWLGKKVSELEKIGKNPIELCGIHWKKIVEEIQSNKALLENRYLEVKYEDLIADVPKEINKILEFCDLRKTNIFFNLLPKFLPNMNEKWKRDLDEDQIRILNKTLTKFLNELGYE